MTAARSSHPLSIHLLEKESGLQFKMQLTRHSHAAGMRAEKCKHASTKLNRYQQTKRAQTPMYPQLTDVLVAP